MGFSFKQIERTTWYQFFWDGNLKTVHVGYVKFMYLMLDSFTFLIINIAHCLAPTEGSYMLE